MSGMLSTNQHDVHSRSSGRPLNDSLRLSGHGSDRHDSNRKRGQPGCEDLTDGFQLLLTTPSMAKGGVRSWTSVCQKTGKQVSCSGKTGPEMDINLQPKRKMVVILRFCFKEQEAFANCIFSQLFTLFVGPNPSCSKQASVPQNHHH